MSDTCSCTRRAREPNAFTVLLSLRTSEAVRKRPLPTPADTVIALSHAMSAEGCWYTCEMTPYQESVPSVLPPPEMKAFSTPTATAVVGFRFRQAWNEKAVRLPNPERNGESEVMAVVRPMPSRASPRPKPAETEPSSWPFGVQVPLGSLVPRVLA